MKKFTLAAAAIFLLAAACKPNNPPVAQPQNPEPKPQVYRNSMYNFEFEYPEEFSFTNPNYANLQDKVVQISLENEAYPQTNFGDAAFTVSVGTASSEQQCMESNSPENGDGFKNSTNINGTPFKYTSGNGAAAGNRYDTKTYRSFRASGNLCYEVALTVHTTNIGNYDPGAVTEVDADKVWARLDNILKTFKFN